MPAGHGFETPLVPGGTVSSASGAQVRMALGSGFKRQWGSGSNAIVGRFRSPVGLRLERHRRGDFEYQRGLGSNPIAERYRAPAGCGFERQRGATGSATASAGGVRL